jgi:hypothetical protein
MKDKTCFLKFTVKRGDTKLGWYIMDLQKRNKVQKGKFKVKIYPPPDPALPFSDAAYKKLKAVEKGKLELEYKIDYETYSRDAIDEFKKGGKNKTEKKKDKEKPEKEKKDKEEKKSKDDKSKKVKKITKVTKTIKKSRIKDKKKPDKA